MAVMLVGIGFVAILTGAAAERFMRARREEDRHMAAQLDEIVTRLDAMERRSQDPRRPSAPYHRLTEDSSDAETPVGRILLFLHESCIFDVDETPAATDARRASEESAEQADPEFWDRLTRETLAWKSHNEDTWTLS